MDDNKAIVIEVGIIHTMNPEAREAGIRMLRQLYREEKNEAVSRAADDFRSQIHYLEEKTHRMRQALVGAPKAVEAIADWIVAKFDREDEDCGRQIDAIKELREITGLGLAESKYAIDAAWIRPTNNKIGKCLQHWDSQRKSKG